MKCEIRVLSYSRQMRMMVAGVGPEDSQCAEWPHLAHARPRPSSESEARLAEGPWHNPGPWHRTPGTGPGIGGSQGRTLAPDIPTWGMSPQLSAHINISHNVNKIWFRDGKIDQCGRGVKVVFQRSIWWFWLEQKWPYCLQGDHPNMIRR